MIKFTLFLARFNNVYGFNNIFFFKWRVQREETQRYRMNIWKVSNLKDDKRIKLFQLQQPFDVFHVIQINILQPWSILTSQSLWDFPQGLGTDVLQNIVRNSPLLLSCRSGKAGFPAAFVPDISELRISVHVLAESVHEWKQKWKKTSLLWFVGGGGGIFSKNTT